MTKTLANLRTEAEYISDQTNGSFISDAEWNIWINGSLAELYHHCINLDPENFVSGTAHSISLVSGTHTYDLASDNYRVYAVDLLVGSYRYNLQRHTIRERNKWQDAYVTNTYEQVPVFRWFTPTNDDIQFTPTPSSAYTVEVWYIPSLTELSSDSDTTPAALENHWLKYVTTGAAIQAKIKAEEDYRALAGQKQQILNMIEQDFASKYLHTSQYAIDISEGSY